VFDACSLIRLYFLQCYLGDVGGGNVDEDDVVGDLEEE
jgi:hypothetical protein